jgi:hypothetical protein
MKTSINNPVNNNGKVIAGAIILVIGSVLLIQQFSTFFIPDWLLSWPMFMIAYGVYMGGKYNFRKPIWIWMVMLGTAFLITENVGNADRFIWPVTIIGLGVWMVTKHRRHNEIAYPGEPLNRI